MCGRARLSTDYSEIKIVLRLDGRATPALRPSWNIAPSAPVLTVRSDNGQRLPEIMRWGLLPAWSKDGKAGSTHNARAETVATKPTFRGPWRSGRRCLVVFDGFYEWRKSDKQPFAVAMADKSLMTLAGLWDEWISPDGEVIRSCTVITTSANDRIGAFHDRMPMIIGEADWPAWLGEVPVQAADLTRLLAPCPDDWVRAWPIHKRIGNVRENDSHLLDAL